MSIKAITWVWEHSPYKGTQLLIHLSLADIADEEGQTVVNYEWLADRARCSELEVVYTLHLMRDNKDIAISEKAVTLTSYLESNPLQPIANRKKKYKSVIHKAPTIAARDNGWQCFYCHVALIPYGIAPDDPAYPRDRYSPCEVDHRFPKSRGGSDHLDNLVLACNTCNARKGAKSDTEFLLWLSERGELAVMERIRYE